MIGRGPAAAHGGRPRGRAAVYLTCLLACLVLPLGAARAQPEGAPVADARLDALRTEARYLKELLDATEGLRAERDRLRASLRAIRERVPTKRVRPEALADWAKACDVALSGPHVEAPAAAEVSSTAEGLRSRRWELTIDGELADIACLVERVMTDGHAFTIERLQVDPVGARARGRLIGVEWTTTIMPYAVAPPSVRSPALPADASPELRALAREVAALRRQEVQVRAGISREKALVTELAEATREVIARIERNAWHASALAAIRRIEPLDGALILTPAGGTLSGELLSDADRALATAVPVPRGITWDIDGLRPARQPKVTLPQVPAEQSETALVVLDAADAPTSALGVLLGGAYLGLVPDTGPDARRFTGRIDAGTPQQALDALRRAVPELTARSLVLDDDGGEHVSLKLVDADSDTVDRMLAEVAGRRGGVRCLADIGVTLGARDVPVHALTRALGMLYAADPRCTQEAPPKPPPADPPTAPAPGWRLVATLRDGTMRTALFETPEGRLHLFADRGEWDEVFRRFERGRVVMPTPSVHVLERRPAPVREPRR